jgi:thiol:disulfide interchange protein DsbD
MRMGRLIVVFFCLVAVRPATAVVPTSVSVPVSAPHVIVQLMNEEFAVYAPDAIDAGVYFKLEPGWHVYWKNAGDSGEPPKIDWTLPKGIQAQPMQFPAPKRLPLGPLMDFGYENEVLFPVRLLVDSTLKPGSTINLAAKVSWLVCREVCIPGKANLELDVPVAGGKPAGNGIVIDLFKRLESTLPTPLPAQSRAVFQTTPTGFRLAVETGQRETSAEFFPADQDIVDNPAPQKLTPTAKGFVLDLKKDANLSANPAQLKGVLELSGGRAYDIAAIPGTVSSAAAGGAPSLAWGLLVRATGLAFLGGLLLNLMPCVFPVLFLKGLALVHTGHKQLHNLRTHGLVYALGILVSFWALVGALLGLRAAGATLGWGFQFQSPVFLALMAGLLFFLGLSLAGQFEIGLTLTSAGGSLAQKQGYSGSFFTGVLAVVVATPCTAPFMGAAVGYALAQSAAVTFAVFTALALGLAAPYVALTLHPAWTRLLPKPGAWMEVLRQAVAVPIFATVIWLAWALTRGYGAGLLVSLLCSLLLLAVAGWFLGRWPATRWATVVAALIVLGVIAVDALAPKRLVEPVFDAGHVLTAGINTGGWQPWSAEAVSRYQAEGRPVFVDFTASWCLSCQVNERVALQQPQVQQAFKDANVALLRADWTRGDDAITQALTAMGRSGVPAYALYIPGQSEPELLPEALTPGIVTDALAKLPKTGN